MPMFVLNTLHTSRVAESKISEMSKGVSKRYERGIKLKFVVKLGPHGFKAWECRWRCVRKAVALLFSEVKGCLF
jgi:hypothetical protein